MTHHVSHHPLSILYTVVVKRPKTESGCPVSYLFTVDHSAAPLEPWLLFLRGLGLSPWKGHHAQQRHFTRTPCLTTQHRTQRPPPLRTLQYLIQTRYWAVSFNSNGNFYSASDASFADGQDTSCVNTTSFTRRCANCVRSGFGNCDANYKGSLREVNELTQWLADLEKKMNGKMDEMRGLEFERTFVRK